MLDDALFDFGSEAAEPAPPSTPPPIATWQADLIRKNFDDSGQTSMHERKEVIERVTGRSVSSLDDLTLTEAYTVLSHMEKIATPRPRDSNSSTAWDNRDSNTWIDRL